MKQPPGYVHPHHLDHVCSLRKALYDLKQAPRAWYQRFAVYISSIGFTSRSDNSLFTFHRGLEIIYLLLYVDDIILTYSNPSLITSHYWSLVWVCYDELRSFIIFARHCCYSFCE